MDDGRPAAEGVAAGHFPGPPVAAGHVAPCPRRVRARDDGAWVLDTTRAWYVWEHPYYPQLAVPVDALADDLRPRADALPDGVDLDGHVLLRFDDAEAWYEEDERVHGHPRNPYVRVDALRSDRHVVVTTPSGRLADSRRPVAVFETGLPPRWYLDPTDVVWSLLTPTDSTTRCPYKGLATDWWRTDDLDDVAWSYPDPTSSVATIAGMVCFDDTLVDVTVTPT